MDPDTIGYRIIFMIRIHTNNEIIVDKSDPEGKQLFLNCWCRNQCCGSGYVSIRIRIQVKNLNPDPDPDPGKNTQKFQIFPVMTKFFQNFFLK
jgi:hypothetical protein